ncbi:GNAT family N-acetyltransferase [Fictibacillus norfolkensis]|uniref:GNAT family N-acetyltransferase n=1 Tax=Fictibacillus norfolkensis TaxID=2762233 RepID=A0ABR8SN37_9BACL|nr:GNAT family N-acetyltransferase [Fictibacillus norfolkensis]MBD7964915.1 GNAT family N-acetyltransferase [Fictibacillus norfolkensis]
MKNIKDAVTFNELKWDTEFFGVSSSKAILHRPLTLQEWDELKKRFKEYKYISIMNKHSEPINAQLIGKDTSAFLADVNMQFEKKIVSSNEMPTNVTIQQILEKNEQIIQISDFQFSKFTEDPELAKRGGDKIYRQWLINSFGQPDKFYALSRNENGDINGFILFSYSDGSCVIELIAVSKKETKGGIGTSLFKAVEQAAHQRGYSKIKVGTQVRNMGAINFYHKVGCKQIGCHQVYHLWNS